MVLWIFGYGSLIWTPHFHYEERMTGYVKDYGRVFLEDERGVDPSTGSGSTEGVGFALALEPQKGATTGGVAYRVTADVEHEILSAYLKESQSTDNAPPRALMLDFFTSEGSATPAISGVITYITAPQSCSLWYVVRQQLAAVGTADITQRSYARSDRPHVQRMMISGPNDQRLTSRRISRRYGYQNRYRA